MGLDLPTEAVNLPERRTEGWSAGLQLAALSVQGQADTAGFITSLTSSHRFIERAQPVCPLSYLRLSSWAGGDLDAACRAFAEVAASFRKVGNLANSIDLGYALAEVRVVQGRLHEALGICQEYRQWVGAQREPLRGAREHPFRTSLYRPQRLRRARSGVHGTRMKGEGRARTSMATPGRS